MFSIIIFSLAGLITILLIIALLLPKSYKVEKEVVISKPKTEVFNYIKFLKNQNNYSVWNQLDPNMKKEYVGEDGTLGFVSKWDGNKAAGKGEMEIKKLVENDILEIEIRFERPWKSVSPAYMTLESLDGKTTKVKWGMTGNMSYPLNLMLLFVNMDKAIGKDLQKGLDNLKVILEK